MIEECGLLDYENCLLNSTSLSISYNLNKQNLQLLLLLFFFFCFQRINSIRQHKDIKCVEKSIQLSIRNTPNFNNSVSLIDLSPPHLCTNPICLTLNTIVLSCFRCWYFVSEVVCVLFTVVYIFNQ
jgi:hypothetical protein